MNRAERRGTAKLNPATMTGEHGDDLDRLRRKWFDTLDAFNVPELIDTLAKRRINGLVQAGRAMADAIITMTPVGTEQHTALKNCRDMVDSATEAIKNNPPEEN